MTFSGTELIALITLLVGVTTGLIKIIDKLISKKNGSTNGTSSGIGTVIAEKATEKVYQKQQYEWSEQNNKWLAHIHELVEKTDDNGVPLIYVPRSLESVQKETVALLNKLVSNQEKTAYILDRLYNKLDTSTK